MYGNRATAGRCRPLWAIGNADRPGTRARNSLQQRAPFRSLRAPWRTMATSRAPVPAADKPPAGSLGGRVGELFRISGLAWISIHAYT